MREIHPVIFHRPGPGWDHALPMFEQDGLQAHLDHYRGPFMDDSSGGMMIGKPTLSLEEAQRHAAEDPCVQSGLLIAEVRPWYQAMKA
jgi:hypothetical protein